jgi:CBS domain-containing membrane protein
MYRLRVRDIMSTDLVTLDEDETLQLAELAMQHGRIRHLPVVSKGALTGLVTHRDILKAQVSSLADVSQKDLADLKLSIPVRKIMATDIKTVEPETPVIEAASLLKSHKFGCLPVVEDGQLVGIVTEADFIDLAIRALKALQSE